MRPAQDMQHIRLVGMLCVALGVILFILSLFLVLVGFVSVAVNHRFSGAWLPTALLFLSGASLMACGIQLQKFKSYTGIESVRLAWAALVIVSVATGIAAAWIMPPLAGIFMLLLFALFTARGPIIRLTR